MQETLFQKKPDLNNTPLAALVRPACLDDFIGQEHILGKSKPLRKSIENDNISSLIFYGPPGVGKTSLAYIISKKTNLAFFELNAVASTVKDLRESVKKAKELFSYYNKKTIVFIDEIHRFNKTQQDALLPYVEDGTIVFIGATTENPYFAVNAPLISRSRVYEFKSLNSSHIKQIILKVIENSKNLGAEIIMDNDVMDFFIKKSRGDARRVLNAMEMCIKTLIINEKGEIVVDMDFAEEVLNENVVYYDKTGNEHYDTASALIKSMRGSDVDSALYWLAKMICAGEDIDFIGRRIAICASEDVGNADPHAILVAKSAWDIARAVGYPEAKIPLSQAVCYVATAPKSNSCYSAINQAIEDIKNKPIMEVPLYLKSSNFSKKGVQYKYPHDYDNNFVFQKYAPIEKYYYKPTENGYESIINKRRQTWKKNKE
jgi:putative ATPase